MEQYLDIFEYEELHDDSMSCFQVANVTMLQDFGPLKKGQEINTLMLDFESGVCSVYNTGEHLDAQFKFTLSAQKKYV